MSALLIFMLLCACIKPLDFLIHGMHFPSNLPHRYTFIYSFIMLYIAYKGLLNIKSCKFEFVVYAGIFYTIVILVTEFVMVPAISDIDRVLSNSDIIINIVAMIGYSYFIYAYSKAKPEMIGGILGVIFVCVFAECMFSSEQGLDRTTDREAYVKYIDGADEAVDYMNDKENGNFYRTEFRRFTSINDGGTLSL